MSLRESGTLSVSGLGEGEAEFRSWLLARLMQLSVVVGMLMLLLWIPPAISQRLYLQVGAFLGLYGLFLVLALVRSGSSTMRSYGFLLLLLSTGVSVLAQNGLVGAGRFWLILVPLLATVLIGRRGAWLWGILTAGVYGLIAWAYAQGHLVALQSQNPADLRSWLIELPVPVVVVLVVSAIIKEYRAYLALSVTEVQRGAELAHQLRLQSQNEAEQALRRAERIDQVASLSHGLARIRDREVLLQRLADGLVTTLGLYQANVFMPDSRGERLELVAAAGAQGREMVESGWTLLVGDDSLPGRVAQIGKPESMLPDRDIRFPLRSTELALPMLSEGDLLGVLSIYGSREPFSEEDVRVLGMLADQVAIMLNGLLLLEETAARAEELRNLNLQMTRSSWRSLLESERMTADVQIGALPGPEVEAVAAELLADGKAHVTELVDGDGGWLLMAPLSWRDAKLGYLAFTRLGERGKPAVRWDQDAVQFATAAAERLAGALDTVRLLSDSRRRALYQEQLARLGDSIWSSLDVESVMRNGVRELGAALDASEVVLALAPPSSTVDMSPGEEFPLQFEAGEERR